jgi:CheY-like chemotaxis protein
MEKQKLIMYIDDDEDDRELLTDAIRKADPDVHVLLEPNGLEAINHLRQLKETEQTLPCLIVLDLNMPFLDGKATFEKLQEDYCLQKVPVMVFSSSEKPQDKQLFNQMGVEFFTKPSNTAYMNQIVHHMIASCC